MDNRLYIVNYTHRFNEVGWEVYWFHLVRPSVRPSVDRIVSTLYLPQYWPNPFHICTSYQTTSEDVWHARFIAKFQKLKFGQIFAINNLNFVLFWLRIQYESILWVIMGQQRVSSERRHSSCSSLFWMFYSHFQHVQQSETAKKLHWLKFTYSIKIMLFAALWFTCHFSSFQIPKYRHSVLSKERHSQSLSRSPGNSCRSFWK